MVDDQLKSPIHRSDREAGFRKVDWTSAQMQRKIKRRYGAERRFRLCGLGAIVFALLVLCVLAGSIISKGYGAFWQTYIQLDVDFDPTAFSGKNDQNAILGANYHALLRQALQKEFPDVKQEGALRDLAGLVSGGAVYDVRAMVLGNSDLIGHQKKIWVLASDEIDMLNKGYIDETLSAGQRRISDREIGWFHQLKSRGMVEQKFNIRFFTGGDSHDPELAGIWAAMVGSFYTLLVTFAVSFPVGVLAAIYLEEFASHNRMSAFFEVIINNLAAVPSIVYGLLGLELYLNVMHLPRSAPLVGGLTLALMTMPTIIIAARSAIKAVPLALRQASLALGASKVQTVFHHVIPLALPGICTGTIIGMARALGETAPLLMIGMVAFIVNAPDNALAPSTVLPVQIYLWANSPEQAFIEKTSAAILVLMAFLLLMNGAAVYLRKKFERNL